MVLFLTSRYLTRVQVPDCVKGSALHKSAAASERMLIGADTNQSRVGSAIGPWLYERARTIAKV